MSLVGAPSAGPQVSFGGRRQSRTFHAHVIWKLGVAIVGGRYPENEVLPGDAELIAQLGVSRTVLREALKTLSAKGLIEARARVGTRVLPRARWNLFDADVLAWHLEARFDLHFLASLAEVRMALEPEAAALAAERHSPAQGGVLIAQVEKMAAAGQSADLFARQDFEFHRMVAEASGNPFMHSISGLVEVALKTLFAVSSPTEGGAAFTLVVEHHRAIAEAIGRGDAEGARASMRHAIQHGFDRAALRMEA